MFKFNIIYTPNTVKYLIPFAKSIVKHNDIYIRLVSNNCTNEELKILNDETEINPNFLFHKIDTKTTLAHHEVLNQLFELDNDDFFAFMDSDIFCNGSFMSTFFNSLQNNSTVFSCKPISISPKIPEINKLQGRHFHDNNNNLIGGSYFAIYKRKDIMKIMNSLDFLFDRKNWSDLKPTTTSQLKLAGMVYEKYDTAKLLNFALRENGFKLNYLEHQNLFHIGGLSWNNSLIGKNKNAPQFSNSILGQVLKKRLKIAQYFSDYISFCLGEKKQPEPPKLSESENEKMLKIIFELKNIYTE